jgi:hypothetical protein
MFIGGTRKRRKAGFVRLSSGTSTIPHERCIFSSRRRSRAANRLVMKAIDIRFDPIKVGTPNMIKSLWEGRISPRDDSNLEKDMPMARLKKPAIKLHEPTELVSVRLYTLEVFLLGGPIEEQFAKKNRTVARTIRIRGDQTLKTLHNAIFDAFNRFDEHMYEFQFGKKPMDPKAARYVLQMALEFDMGETNPPVGRVDRTSIESLGLKVGSRFAYWFDFGDDWWHQITVEAIEDEVPRGKFPKVIKRVGESPPQYPLEDESEEDE